MSAFEGEGKVQVYHPVGPITVPLPCVLPIEFLDWIFSQHTQATALQSENIFIQSLPDIDSYSH